MIAGKGKSPNPGISCDLIKGYNLPYNWYEWMNDLWSAMFQSTTVNW